MRVSIFVLWLDFLIFRFNVVCFCHILFYKLPLPSSLEKCQNILKNKLIIIII